SSHLSSTHPPRRPIPAAAPAVSYVSSRSPGNPARLNPGATWSGRIRPSSPGHEVQGGHHERVRVGEMLTDLPVQLVQLPFLGQSSLEDQGAHAAHQVKAYRAPAVTGRVYGRPPLHPDILQPRLTIQLGQATSDARIGAVPAERSVKELADAVKGGMSRVAHGTFRGRLQARDPAARPGKPYHLGDDPGRLGNGHQQGATVYEVERGRR